MSAQARPQKIVVHVCHGCLRQFATYEGTIPRGWAAAGRFVCCPRCKPKKATPAAGGQCPKTANGTHVVREDTGRCIYCEELVMAPKEARP